MRAPSSIVAFGIVTATVSSVGLAQSPAGVTRSLAQTNGSSHTLASTPVQRSERDYGSFALQSLGGTVGSAAGLAIGLAVTNDCDGEDDVVCGLKKASLTGAIGVIGATVGVAVVGRDASQRPSIIGSLLGGVVGSIVGIGLHHLITEEMSQQIPDVGTIALFTLSQGTFAAAGGRIGAMIRAGP